MKFTRFLNLLGLFVVLFCIHSSTGQVSLQSNLDTDSKIELKNALKDSKVTKNLSNIPSGVDFNDPSLPWRLPQTIKPNRYDLEIVPILEAGHEETFGDQWLPQTIKPNRYDLEIVPILEAGHEETFGDQWTSPGTLKINITALEATNQITLHIKDLLILNVTVNNGITNLPITGTSYNEEYMHYTIHMENNLVAGQNYFIDFNYIAQIQTELHGLYRTSYVDPASGETKWGAVTQMEALNARELFPCFDETSFKAVFAVSIYRLEKHVALANGQSTGNTTVMAPGWIVESFEPTVPMSTYLFAIVISEFEYAEAPGAILPETVVRTYAPKHFIERQGGVYAAEKAEIVMKYYEDYFGQEYPMSKMDMAGVPAFFFGAMENFGLNIYREDALLYFPDESTEAERLRVTQVIAHELAHQWFGNLVSPAFWTHVWLNEGVSSYIEFIGIQAIAPEFNGWDIFVVNSIQNAMQVDSVETHPLKIDEAEWYEKPAMDWFDGITYQKGGSIMGMVEGFLTEPVLQKALRNYQSRMKFSAAIQDDLFQELGIEADLANKLPTDVTMKSIMDGWTLQTGFPLLTVTRNGTNVLVKQSKYKDPTSLSRWIVPVSYATQDNPNFDPEPELWLVEETATIQVESISNWIILNAGATGYYRVQYDASIEAQIVQQLEANHVIINHRTRSQLLDDYFNFAWQESIEIETALQFTKYLATSPESEVEMPVWTTILNNLKKSYDLFSSTPILEDFKKYLIPRINKAIQATGGHNAINLDSKGMVVLRHKLLLDWACSNADYQCLDYALELVNTWKLDIENSPVPRDLKPVVYCGAVANGGTDVFNFIYQQYGEAGISSKQQNLLLNSLACASESEVVNRLLNATLEEGFFLTKAHGETILKGVAGNTKARQALLKFLSENVQKIISYFGAPTPIVGAFAELSKYMSTEGELAQLEAFIAANQGIFQTSLDGYVSATRRNIDWVAKFGPSMQQFFIQNA